jgi:hypothetical protein
MEWSVCTDADHKVGLVGCAAVGAFNLARLLSQEEEDTPLVKP